MQRQSLGSPVSKPYNHGVVKDDTDLIHNDGDTDFTDDDNDNNHRKSTKPPRRFSFSSSSSSMSSFPLSSSTLVHCIPFLTFLCFLLLYLVSHTPSQSDLAHFHGIKQSSRHLDSNEISDSDSLGDLTRRADTIAIRNQRNLQEIAEKGTSPESHSHRKLMAGF